MARPTDRRDTAQTSRPSASSKAKIPNAAEAKTPNGEIQAETPHGVPGVTDWMKEVVPALGASFALFAALWYGLLSLACTVVYDGVGVEPREVGLNSGAVLAQAGIAFAAFLAFFVVFQVVVLVLAYLMPGKDRSMSSGRRAFVLALCTIFVLIFALAVNVIRGRDDLRRAISPASFFSISLPWKATVAELHWATAPQPGFILPSCALYLGQADQTVVLESPGGGSGGGPAQTLKLPAASIILRLRTDESRCPK